MDILQNWRHRRHADTTQRGVHLTFADNDIAIHAKPINRSLDGAAYDPGTRAGLPLVGQGGGVYVADDAASYWQGAAYAAGVAIGGEHEVTALPAAARIIAQNGADHLARVDAAGQFEVSLNSGATYSTAAWNALGRGPFHWVATHDGTNQRLWINGRDVDSDVAALDVPAGNLQVGRSGETCRLWCLPSQPDARSRYLTELARRVLWQWQPRDCGEGPVGGILTGSYSGVGGWTCPLGAATMKFVWVNDLSLPGGGYLALTDTGALSMARIDLDLGRLPAFGSWLVRYKLRNPVFGGDNPRIGLIPMRGVDMTSATAGSYWVEAFNTGGGWWRTQTYRNNVLIGVDADHAVTAADDDCAFLVTHHVDGNWRIYSYSRMLGTWAWRAAAVVNDVTNLNYQTLSIASRGSLIKSVECLQGEQTHAELARVVS